MLCVCCSRHVSEGVRQQFCWHEWNTIIIRTMKVKKPTTLTSKILPGYWESNPGLPHLMWTLHCHLSKVTLVSWLMVSYVELFWCLSLNCIVHVTQHALSINRHNTLQYQVSAQCLLCYNCQTSLWLTVVIWQQIHWVVKRILLKRKVEEFCYTTQCYFITVLQKLLPAITQIMLMNHIDYSFSA